MPVLAPPPCEETLDLDPAAVARFITKPNEQGLGIIIACDPPYWCRPWPELVEIPPRWVEAQADDVTRETLDTGSCDLSTYELDVPEYIDVATGLVSPRDARAPRVPRARRPPRPPRPGRRPRSPRKPREPRAPRPPREPREPRSQRPVGKLARGWAGWPQAYKTIVSQDDVGGKALPYGDRWCVIDYLDGIPFWEKTVLSLGSDDAVCEYLARRFGSGGVCAGDGMNACEQFANELKNIADTIDKVINPKSEDPKKPRPRAPRPPGGPRPPGPDFPTDQATPRELPDVPAPEDRVYFFWSPTPSYSGPFLIPTGYVLRLPFPLQPTDVGFNNQFVNVGQTWTGDYLDGYPG